MANTKAKLLELESQAAGRQSMPFDQMLRLAGRILRSSNSDPLRQASYKPDSAELFEGGGRRVGRPRQQWLSDADSLVYARYSNYPYDGSAHQNGLILQKAQNREFYGSPVPVPMHSSLRQTAVQQVG